LQILFLRNLCCGKRSAWSKAGGYAPLCYESDIIDEMVKEYRKIHK